MSGMDVAAWNGLLADLAVHARADGARCRGIGARSRSAGGRDELVVVRMGDGAPADDHDLYGVAVLMVLTPVTRLNEDEIARIGRFVDNGGRVVFVTGPDLGATPRPVRMRTEVFHDPATAHTLIADEAGRPLVIDQALGNGRVTMVTDRNWLDTFLPVTTPKEIPGPERPADPFEFADSMDIDWGDVGQLRRPG